MSYHSEHKRMKPVIQLARRYDIATNPDPGAIFEAGNSGFQVWCTPHDHPADWNGITMHPGAFSKPCEYVGSVHWKWDEDRIVALEIETTAYALADQKPLEYNQSMALVPGDNRCTIFNRNADIAWLKEKTEWLFSQAGIPMPPFEYDEVPLADPYPHILTHYMSETDEYVVIVSPEMDPREFCKPGYEIIHTMEIWRAGAFPVDVILRPDHDYQEVEIEPDEGPLVEQYENASRLGDDDWLEAAMEDTISGWGE